MPCSLNPFCYPDPPPPTTVGFDDIDGRHDCSPDAGVAVCTAVHDDANDARRPNDVLVTTSDRRPMVCRYAPSSGDPTDAASTWVCSEDVHRLELAYGARVENAIDQRIERAVTTVDFDDIEGRHDCRLEMGVAVCTAVDDGTADVRTPRDVLPESGSGAPMVCRHVPWSGNAADSSSTWVCSDDAHRLELAHGAKMRNFIADTVDHTVSAVINIKLAPVLTKNTSQQTEIDDLIKDMDKPYGKISYIQEDIKANKSAVSRLNAMLRGELRGKNIDVLPSSHEMAKLFDDDDDDENDDE